MRFLPCLYAFLGCISFCFIFQVRKPLFIFLCSAIGAVSWGVYLLAEPLGSDAVRCFVATIVVSALAELLARLRELAAELHYLGVSRQELETLIKEAYES